ncbi:MAG: hypothetical protein ACTHOF_07710 [Flavisolibacter sp.]
MTHKCLIVWVISKENIYNIPENVKKIKAEIENTSGSIEFSESSVDLRFNYEGYGYSICFKHLIQNIYEGQILNDNQSWGLATLHLYSFENKYLGRLEWKLENYECDAFLIIEPS